MGRPDLVADPQFDTPAERQRGRDALDSAIAAWTGERDHYQVMHILQAHGVPAGAVAKGSDLIRDPHLNTRGFWDTVDNPEAGVYKQVTTPWYLSETPRQQTVPSPGLGEHNDYALKGLLGLTETEVRELEEAEIIGTQPAESA
jgi:crotonobetainyl-CoA:carnitine CoA-transferase CaiB-like acyl-CoA transferase